MLRLSTPVIASALLLGLLSTPPPGADRSDATAAAAFGHAEHVVIEGYEGDAMEPFISRDGRYLFFNDLNERGVDTNLHWAERVDDLHFKYRGELRGVNTAALDAVASMDREGNFYFVSTRSYDQTASTVYEGRFGAGQVDAVRLVPGLSLAKHGIVNFDAEICADGDTLYFVESQFGWFGGPKWAHILMARKVGERFIRSQRDEELLATINSVGLNYVPATSSSQREIFFTRALPGRLPEIYMASRAGKQSAFGPAARVPAITGFAEAPTLSPDERSLYYHLKEKGHFTIYRVTRH